METICALSTPAGSGGIAVIRVSGPDAIAVVSRHFASRRSDHALDSRPTHTLTFGQFLGTDGTALDEVVASLFRAPHSFTGEDVVELSCHCSPYIINNVLSTLVADGCRVAAPGEFTQRAYLNGRMDLSQAEAVADLIASTSAAQHRAALSQLKGGFSRRLSELRGQLLTLTSLLELELDFADHEELEFADRSEVLQLAQTIDAEVRRLIASFRTGNAVRHGIPVAIVGAPNVGKSSLLNALVGDERAIVTDIPGTTRDVIDATMQLAGHTLRFIDTAGIRQTTDTIEALGIERSLAQLSQADIVLWVVDATATPSLAASSSSSLSEASSLSSAPSLSSASLSAATSLSAAAPVPNGSPSGSAVAASSASLSAATSLSAAVPVPNGSPSGPAVAASSASLSAATSLSAAPSVPNGSPSGPAVAASPLLSVSDATLYQLIASRLQPHQHCLVVRNKCDLLVSHTAATSLTNGSLRAISATDTYAVPTPLHVVNTCAHTTEGIEPLLDALAQLINLHYTQQEADVIVTNARHHEALQHAADSLSAVIAGLTQGIPSDLVCEDLRLVLHHLAAITGGEITPQETLNNIFSHFCIGK